MVFKRILKILGFIILPILPMAVAIYFLFPYINDDKYEDVAKEYRDGLFVNDSTNVDLSSFPSLSEAKNIKENLARLEQENSEYSRDIDSLQQKVDSLTTVNESLEEQLSKIETERIELSDKEFSENIKSLLDLDVENLGPILSKMSDDEIIRIFKASSGLERKKLLRSLESDRAAKLMQEVL